MKPPKKPVADHDTAGQKAAAIEAMRRGELTPAQVAQFMGIARQSVYKWCKAAGIEPEKAAQRHAAAIWHRITSGQYETKAQKTRRTAELVKQYYEQHPDKRRPATPRRTP